MLQAESGYGGPLPTEYVELLRNRNGGSTGGILSIYDVEKCVERNFDYEVPEYLPGYFMIGDDGGGTAILYSTLDLKQHDIR